MTGDKESTAEVIKIIFNEEISRHSRLMDGLAILGILTNNGA